MRISNKFVNCIRGAIWKVLELPSVILIFMLSNSPDDTISNLSQWLRFVGLENFPNFLSNPTIDFWLKGVCWIFIILGVLSIIITSIEYWQYRNKGAKYLTELYSKGLSLTHLIISLISEDNHTVLGFESLPKKILKWRNKVKAALPKQYVFDFDNLPESIEGPLNTYLLMLHRHSLAVLAMAARNTEK